MFEIGWSEMLVIAVVLIVVVGPKDLPKMLRTFGKTVAKLRGMAGDFQKQFNEALKEAELDGVKKSIDDIRGLNPMNDIKKSLNPFEKAAADVRAGLDKALKPDAPTPASPVAHTAEPLKAGPDVMPAGPAPELSTSAPAGLVATNPPEPTPSTLTAAAPLTNGSGVATPAAVAASVAKPARKKADPAPAKTAAAAKPAKPTASAAKARPEAPAKTKPVAMPASPAAKPTASAAKPAAVKPAISAKPAQAKVAAVKDKPAPSSKSAAANGAKRQGSSK